MQSSVASFFAGSVAYSILTYSVSVFTADTLMTVFFQGALAACAGMATFFGVQYLFKNQEFSEVFGMCKNRLSRKSPMVAPQDEDTLSV